MSTFFGFECQDCGMKAGQVIIVTNEEEDEKEKVKCPKCGSTNCTYKTGF